MEKKKIATNFYVDCGGILVPRGSEVFRGQRNGQRRQIYGTQNAAVGVCGDVARTSEERRSTGFRARYGSNCRSRSAERKDRTSLESRFRHGRSRARSSLLSVTDIFIRNLTDKCFPFTGKLRHKTSQKNLYLGKMGKTGKNNRKKYSIIN